MYRTWPWNLNEDWKILFEPSLNIRFVCYSKRWGRGFQVLFGISEISAPGRWNFTDSVQELIITLVTKTVIFSLFLFFFFCFWSFKSQIQIASLLKRPQFYRNSPSLKKPSAWSSLTCGSWRGHSPWEPWALTTWPCEWSGLVQPYLNV